MSAPSIIETLDKIVAPKFRPEMRSDCWVLREHNQNEFELRSGVRQFAMRLDLPPEPGGLDVAFPFLKTSVPDLTCKCDLIVFIHREEHHLRPLVFLVELKSLQAGDYLKQLRSSREFVLFLFGLVWVHTGVPFEPDIKGVLIRTRRAATKTPTRQINLSFQERGGLDVCECDRGRRLSISDLKRAAEA